MEGTNAHGIQRYRCMSPKTRALPAYLAHHPRSLYVREDAIVTAVDTWLPTLADADWLASTQEPDALIEAQHANLHAQLAEIDKAAGNLVSAIEAGTGPAVINPRLNQLRAEREIVAHQLANLTSPDRLTARDVEALMAELGGLGKILGEATPPEKASIYQGLGLTLCTSPTNRP